MLTATSFPAQAQETINICDRTPQVEEAILKNRQITTDSCTSVLESEMAAISGLALVDKGITSLQLGDFDGLTGVAILQLNNNSLAELQTGIFRNLSSLGVLGLERNLLTTLSASVFSDTPNLTQLFLNNNRLSTLPAGIFSGLMLQYLGLLNNPGDFQFTVKFEPGTLEKGFTASPVRLVLREGAPRTTTVPLQITGPGGALIADSPSALTITRGSTQSDTVVTVVRGKGYFRLAQGELEFGEQDINYVGFDIVRGPPIEFGGVPVRVKVFLEGALE